jgi:ATP-GRASP peptide maturase of grasp-with-spasm system
MVFLFTRIKDDTTVKIIQWLKFFNKEFFRFNTIVDIQSLLKNDEEIISKITSVYFNGGSVIVPTLSIADKELDMQIREHLKSEGEALLESILANANFENEFGLSPFSNIKINKLKVLKEAENIGFRIPDTKIVTTQEQLKDLMQLWGRIVNKSIDNGIFVNTKDWMINGQKTQEITLEQIERMAQSFFPTLIQKLIDKKYEVRVFYYKGYFKSIAIFSQGNKDTQVDWRNNQSTVPIRQIPYNLPEEVKMKIESLMQILKLNYGSVDLMVTPGSEYYFLEVNPYGQFGFVSSAGNYYLEKHLAEIL